MRLSQTLRTLSALDLLPAFSLGLILLCAASAWRKYRPDASIAMTFRQPSGAELLTLYRLP